MPFKHQCLVYEIRYRPLGSSMFAPVAVFLVDQSMKLADVRFTHDYRLARLLDPDFDPGLLEQVKDLVRAHIRDSAAVTELLHNRVEWPSNLFELSVVEGVETNDFELELAVQVDLRLRLKRPSRQMSDVQHSDRPNIRKNMINTWRDYDLWNSMWKSIALRDYGCSSRLKIDCGYMPAVDGSDQREFKMFHAFDIERDRENVAELAHSFHEFSKDFSQRMSSEHMTTRTILTVIGKDWKQSAGEVQAANFDILHKVGIQTQTLADLPELAITARQELGLRPM